MKIDVDKEAVSIDIPESDKNKKHILDVIRSYIHVPANETTPADVLYYIVKKRGWEYFKDATTKQPYVVISEGDRAKTVDMHTADFGAKLRLIFKAYMDDLKQNNIEVTDSSLIGEDNLNKVINQLIAEITEERKLYQRCFSEDSKIFYDLGDGEMVCITNQGYKIERDSHRYFRPADNTRKQVRPKPARPQPLEQGKDMLDKLVNSFGLVDNDDGNKAHLLKVYIMGLFIRPERGYTHPIAAVDGPEGSSKTTMLATIKFLVDPVGSDPRSMVTQWGTPEQKRDRGLAVWKNYYTIFDNISYLTNAESDELCLYSTGGKNEERKLRTNLETVEYPLQGNVAYTSISDVARQSDLISRQLAFTLKRRDTFMLESVYWNQRISERPALLHYFFVTLSKALRIYGQRTRLKYSSIRLSDSVEVYEAISQALGSAPGRITKIFETVKDEQMQRVMSNSEFNDFFMEFCMSYLPSQAIKDPNRRDIYRLKVTSRALYEWMKDYAAKNRPDILKDDEFPKNAVGLGKRLPRLSVQLARVGYVFSKPEHDKKGNFYNIVIEETQS